jgi:hypothetical protein
MKAPPLRPASPSEGMAFCLDDAFCSILAAISGGEPSKPKIGGCGPGCGGGVDMRAPVEIGGPARGRSGAVIIVGLGTRGRWDFTGRTEAD